MTRFYFMKEVIFQTKGYRARERNQTSFLLSFIACNIPSIFLSEFKGIRAELHLENSPSAWLFRGEAAHY